MARPLRTGTATAAPADHLSQNLQRDSASAEFLTFDIFEAPVSPKNNADYAPVYRKHTK